MLVSFTEVAAVYFQKPEVVISQMCIAISRRNLVCPHQGRHENENGSRTAMRGRHLEKWI